MKQYNNSRRKFIGDGAKAAAGVSLFSGTAASILTACGSSKKTALDESKKLAFLTGFTQAPLPYAYNALESIIDAQTMELHYSKHAAGYAKNMNDARKELGLDAGNLVPSIETILSSISKYSTKLRNNAGGHYNHEMFWQCMRPKSDGNAPIGNLLLTIENTFTSFTEFKKQFAAAGTGRFGSGWAWLYVDAKKNLKIGSTPNQDNPLMDVSDIKGFPLLALDVWEHAYYLKYQNKRADYIENWWQVVNWEYVAKRFAAI
jgi:superoxide dismutase, Fe-Mn family